jgi:hypothetical protein
MFVNYVQVYVALKRVYTLIDYNTLTAKHDEIKDLSSYRKTKPIVQKLESVKRKEEYKREHETDFILFNAAKQAVKNHFPSGKYPLIKDLRAEMKELYEEKNRLYPEYYESKEELKSISTIKKNVDTIISQPPERDTEKEREAQNKDKSRDNDIYYF